MTLFLKKTIFPLFMNLALSCSAELSVISGPDTSICILLEVQSPWYLQVDINDFDQTGCMSRLI